MRKIHILPAGVGAGVTAGTQLTTLIKDAGVSFQRATLRLLVTLCLLASTSGDTDAQTYVYLGGEIITSPEVIVVYWGAQQTGIPAFLNDFYRRITQSTYLAPLSEYNVPPNSIGTARFVGSTSINPDESRTLDTLQIARELEQQVSVGNLPPANEHTLYMIHFGPAVKTVMGANLLGIPIGVAPGSSYCSYHLTTRTQTPVLVVPGLFVYGPKIRFAILPDSDASGCSASLGMRAATTVFATHEMAEAITNPDAIILELAPFSGVNAQCNGNFWPTGLLQIPPIGTPPGLLVINGKSPYAWTDNTFNICDPQEVADSCKTAMSFATTLKPDGNYSVSGIRLNSTHSCQVSPVQGTVTDPPPQQPVSAHQICLEGCSDALARCMANAHIGPERAACGREGQACQRGCPP